ncbi:BTB domain containing protein [Pyrenophora tritici-repentis]|uniref:BTB/POZ domain containing protein n=1 Tax=Pyrenophora tritici-repentis TaxID=45151 RepID=A0A2W1E584_9PLEO|nr:BTB domain-containing protein [Pyrenophora tritici-repentis]KAI0574950.1 BTB domain-containing protein [Pyrenophora tritici-repentis]KAI0606326.1 BTB domain-containing protein [Pyrenophora tritici-repentis]KAI0618483.1 BTB domain-containing protein [Pyrenophora tritici-repentis]KAI1518094.1 BTB/POZ domain containing protein [Pyrenophora tritici-repentis]
MAQAMQRTELMESFLTSGDYSDLVIKCGNETFNVHKVIVCTQVEFFARAIKFGGKETQENVIDLPDDDP